MSDNVSITTTYDNKQIELVLNEFFLCPARDINIVDIKMGPKLFYWKFRLVFDKTEQATKYQSKMEYNVDGFQVKITFYNWSSDSWIEMKNPAVLKTTDGKSTFYLKLRTEARPIIDFGRNIQLSIWKAIQG